MKAGKLLALPLLCLLILPAAARAQATTPPTVVLRINSMDSILDYVKFLAGLAGQKDAASQIQGLIKTKIGDKGLEGVDSGRPFGFYGRIGKELDDISGAVLLPIADEKAFLNLLGNLNLQVAKGNDGVYTIKTGSPIDAYLRFANKYAYITGLNTTALEPKNLLDPATVLAGKPTSAFSLTIQLDQVPDAAKLITTAQAEQVLQEAQNKMIPGESPAQRDFRIAALKEVAKLIASVLKDGKQLHTEVDINQKAGDLGASFSISGVAGSDLAKGIEAIGTTTSMFAGLLKRNAAFNSLGHIKLPEAIAKALGDVIDEAQKSALDGIHDATKKQQAESLFKAIVPTFKTGDFDGAMLATVEGQELTVVGGFKVKNGDELGKTVKELVSVHLKDLPPALRQNVQLDLDAVGSTKIHKVEIQAFDEGAKMAAKVLGDLSIYVAFRNDAVLYAVGKKGLQAIKAAIPIQASSKSPMLFYEVDIARLITLAPPKEAEKAKALFPNGQGGIIRLSVTGGQALTIRLNTKVSVLQLFGQLHGQDKTQP
jgi:hypothetical protein